MRLRKGDYSATVESYANYLMLSVILIPKKIKSQFSDVIEINT